MSGTTKRGGHSRAFAVPLRLPLRAQFGFGHIYIYIYIYIHIVYIYICKWAALAKGLEQFLSLGSSVGRAAKYARGGRATSVMRKWATHDEVSSLVLFP